MRKRRKGQELVYATRSEPTHHQYVSLALIELVDGVVGLDHHGQVHAVDGADVVVVVADVAQGELGLRRGPAGAHVRGADVIRRGAHADPRRAAVHEVAVGAAPDRAAPAGLGERFMQVVAEVLARFEHAVGVAGLLVGQIPVAPDAQRARVVDRGVSPIIAELFV